MPSKEEFTVWPVGKHHYRHGSDMLEMPEGWAFAPSGDAALTRRIKAAGEYWLVLEKYRNKISSMGLCAPLATIDRIKKELEVERADPAYQKKLESGRKYREAKQQDYVNTFENEVLAFLAFHERWRDIALKLAKAVTAHATPVGSGTVARTQMIPVEERAEAAVIAWMRHQTTAYDHMYIPRIAGQRREVRRELAAKSRELLNRYRSGENVDLENCPLAKALGFNASKKSQ